MNRKSGAARGLSADSFTERQGQYLAFISTYSHMFRRPPAQTDILVAPEDIPILERLKINQS